MNPGLLLMLIFLALMLVLWVMICGVNLIEIKYRMIDREESEKKAKREIYREWALTVGVSLLICVLVAFLAM